MNHYIKNPSPFQKDIFTFIGEDNGNALVRAVAGSGKTTTIVHAAAMTTGRAVFLAFNKSIAEELKQRLPSHVEARTFHSLCYRPVTDAMRVRRVNDYKLWDIQKESMTEQAGRLYGAFTRKLVGLAKQAGAGVLCPSDEALMYSIVEHHDLELEQEQAKMDVAVDFAMKLLRLSNESSQVDFDDLLYFPVLKGINLPKFDWVFVDEAQDTNAIQRALLKKLMHAKSRLVAVGDPAQAIYGFRGADSDSMDLIAKDFAPAKWLPLSVTYRCPKKVVAEAQAYVPDIQAAPGAPDGEVQDLGEKWKLTDLGPHDLVVCRNTKPLIGLGYQMLRARIPVRIMGREIGEGLKTLVKKCDGGKGDLDVMLNNLEKWRARESEKAEEKGQLAKAELVNDKAESIRMLAEDLVEQDRSVSGLLAILEELFTDKNSRTTLATIHKAKGLEADVVWWLCPSLCPSRWARQPWQQQQERNLMYVAITRAKKKLVKIEMEKYSARKGDKKPEKAPAQAAYSGPGSTQRGQELPPQLPSLADVFPKPKQGLAPEPHDEFEAWEDSAARQLVAENTKDITLPTEVAETKFRKPKGKQYGGTPKPKLKSKKVGSGARASEHQPARSAGNKTKTPPKITYRKRKGGSKS